MKTLDSRRLNDRELKMGCINSKVDINERHPNIFQVANVNEQGISVSPGKLEVTETELVLYQRGKEPTRWPLRSLRKYGFDSEVFSFECGRRCPTGHGIYAFQCRKAEQLFNLVQQYITGSIVDDANNHISPGGLEYPIPVVSTGPPVTRRVPSQPEGYLIPQGVPRPHPSLSRPGSITSNGPVSPTTISPPPVLPEIPLEHNNNKRGSVSDHTYTNSSVLDAAPAMYVNIAASEPPQDPVPVYMNIDTKDKTKELEEITVSHCYANINTKDIETLRPEVVGVSVPQTPTTPSYADLDLTEFSIRDINYAELDLKGVRQVKSEGDGEEKEKKSYATIDFQKTTALSKSKNPGIEEEGSRKTRHNSTISEVARHSNSLSD